MLTTPELRRTPRVAALFDFLVDEVDALRPIITGSLDERRVDGAARDGNVRTKEAAFDSVGPSPPARRAK